MHMSPLRWDMAQKSRTIICYSLVVEALVAFLTLHLDIKIHKCTRLPCAGTWPKRQELLILFASFNFVALYVIRGPRRA